MDRLHGGRCVGLAIACLVMPHVASAQENGPQGLSAPGEALRAQGRFLRGMAWYDLGSARAAAIEADAQAEWNRTVRADYERYLLDRANRLATKKALRNEREQDAV